jgi:GNAT superfamily N-acetyltransferase
MPKQLVFTPPELINKNHDKNTFDCGNDSLNIFLKNYSLQNDKNNSSRTYVAGNKKDNLIIGYYTLTYGSIAYGQATPSVKKNMPQYPIPVMLLARLAVDKKYKNLGVGTGLLKDALLRTMQASEIAGLRAIITHAKDNSAKQFYLKHGFKESPLDNYHMMISLKEIGLLFNNAK